ncbi:hypothetical protein ZEAMMB73_Zm00001d047445 [Zea mays]|uniref:Protein kinase domain-containing protein n=1 Tax=Zea mays TaxID=4577 RepID=A0A1D6P9I6_MAIZE|nr:hypothetical protein ZEAMMB73_Zm00001d047445 [Zea mays]
MLGSPRRSPSPSSSCGDETRMSQAMSSSIINSWNSSIHSPRGSFQKRVADVWSCGVTLYVMLVGSYPFEDPEDPRNFRKTISQFQCLLCLAENSWRVILHPGLCESVFRLQTPSVSDIRCRSFKEGHDPTDKASPVVPEDPPEGDLGEGEGQLQGRGCRRAGAAAQAVDKIMRIVEEAKTPGDMSKVVDPALLAEMAELESDEEEADTDDTY